MRIAIVGAGKVGTAIARVSLSAGHDVEISGSGSPVDIALIVEVVAAGARAAWTSEAAAKADIVVLSTPFPKYMTLSPEMFQEPVVIDAMNYWPPTDGQVAFEEPSSSEAVAAHLRKPRLLKSFGHIGYHELEEWRRPVDHPERRAMALAGAEVDDLERASSYIDSLGYDPVVVTPLARGSLFEPGHPVFGAELSRDSLRRALSDQ